MDVPLVVKHRLKALGLDQKDPATAAQGHRTLHFTIAGAKEGSSSIQSHGHLRKMGRF